MANCNGIGKRIKELREASGLTQSEMAKKLHVRRETIVQWETEARDLKTDYTVKVADLFGVTCDYLLRGIKAENVEISQAIGLSDNAVDALKAMNKIAPTERKQYSGVAMIDIIDGFLSSAKFYIAIGRLIRSETSLDDEKLSYSEDIFHDLHTFFIAPKFSGEPLFLNSVGELKHPLEIELERDSETQMTFIDSGEIAETVLLERLKEWLKQLKGVFWSGKSYERNLYQTIKRTINIQKLKDELKNDQGGTEDGKHPQD